MSSPTSALGSARAVAAVLAMIKPFLSRLYHSGAAELRNVVGGVAELAQDLVRVLAALRRRRRHAARGVAQGDGLRHEPDLAPGRRRHRLRHPEVLHLRVGEDLI